MKNMNIAVPATTQFHDLLYQAIETEIGGEKIYRQAISCAINEDLKEEWQSYLSETRTHHKLLLNVLEKLGLDPNAQLPSRQATAYLGHALVQTIKMAKDTADPQAAQLIAARCIVLAETIDHANWELIGLLVNKMTDKEAGSMKAVYEAVEKDEDHHLYHTQGWARELAIEWLGLPAVLPPPEEVRKVETAIGAARAERAREHMLN